MLLRDGEQIYPIYRYWMGPQMVLPEIYLGDYDGDGEEEYALKTHLKTGTGVSGDELYILEKNRLGESGENPSLQDEDGIYIYEFDSYWLE